MVLQAYTENEQTGAGERLYASAAQVRAAASNALHRGADGVCSWFAECVARPLFSMWFHDFQPGLLVLPPWRRWPHGEEVRAWLSELGDLELMAEKTKHYRIAERSEDAAENGYDRPLPLEIAQADGATHPIPFYVSDAVGTEAGRSRRVVLRMLVQNLLSVSLTTHNLATLVRSVITDSVSRLIRWRCRSTDRR